DRRAVGLRREMSGDEARLEWNEAKARVNAVKHGVTFEEAATVLRDPRAISLEDEEHSESGEERFIVIGRSHVGRLIVVVESESEGQIRLISARQATRRERRLYERKP